MSERALLPEVAAILARARLLALDVDGTLTDGGVRYLGDEELVRFDVKDGQGLVWVREAGVEVAWITGRGCKATEARAAELGVCELHLGTSAKAATLERIQRRLELGPQETIAMGDDLSDLALATRAALLVAPADAHEAVRERAGLVTRACGGRGAVRELCDALLAARDLWKARVDRSVRGRE